MAKNKNKTIFVVLLILVGVISIGYAALNATLNINGTTKINSNQWGVQFKSNSINVTTGSDLATTAPTITGTTVSYSPTLTVPGDKYQFQIVVENTGTIDVKLATAPTMSGVSADQDVYVNYSIAYADGTEIKANDTLAAENTKTLVVTVEYDDDITAAQLPSTSQTLNLSFTMNYVQA